MYKLILCLLLGTTAYANQDALGVYDLKVKITDKIYSDSFEIESVSAALSREEGHRIKGTFFSPGAFKSSFTGFLCDRPCTGARKSYLKLRFEVDEGTGNYLVKMYIPDFSKSPFKGSLFFEDNSIFGTFMGNRREK